MNNTATRMIRSEEITIDMRICTILAGGKKPGEVYFAAIAPDMELTVITLDEAPDILPCFDESDASIHLPDTSLLLCYNPAQVLKMAGKRYLTGPVILVRTNMDGNFISLTIDDVYRFQKFLASHSVTLMADDQKLPCMRDLNLLNQAWPNAVFGLRPRLFFLLIPYIYIFVLHRRFYERKRPYHLRASNLRGNGTDPGDDPVHPHALRCLPL